MFKYGEIPDWVCVCVHAQSCPTLCHPVDCSMPGSSAHGIFQARILEWVAISFSRGIFLTQGSNPGLSHCRQMLYRLSHQGSNSKKYSLFIWNSNLTQYPLVSWASLVAQLVKNPPNYAGDSRDTGLIPGSGRFPWSRKWQLAPVFLLGKFHGQRSLVGYSPWGGKETLLSMAW